MLVRFAPVIAIAFAIAVTAVSCNRNSTPKRQANEYLDTKLCAGCHAEIYRNYSRTGMAKAFYSPNDTSFPKPLPYFHKASRTWYQMVSNSGKWAQRSWQIGLNGTPESVGEYSVDSVMGSGNHVRTYLHRTARNTLIELPLAWYAENGGTWALNPGFDTANPPTGRKVGYDCMFCHNAYPSIPAGHDEAGAEPVFAGALPQSIDCQRCHGPGGDHVRAAQTAGAKPGELRAAIVNPKRLALERSMEVCAQCHLETTSAALPNALRRFDRAPFSFQPGEPLRSFQLAFDHAPGAGKEGKFEIVSSVYRLKQSRCYLQSKSALQCTACHDPHRIEHGQEALGQYNTACLKCHAGGKLQALVEARKHPKEGACVTCHMPKRRTEDVVHAVVTDHLIQRSPATGDLLAPRVERHGAAMDYRGEVVPYGDADELYTAVAQVTQQSNLAAGVPRLKAALEKHAGAHPSFHLELGDALQRTGQSEAAIAEYRKALEQRPTSALLLRRLAQPLRSTGQSQAALEAVQQATRVDPENDEAWYELGLLQSDLGDKAGAIEALRKAVALNPEFADGHNTLGAVLAETGAQDAAETEFRTALRLHPPLPGAHANLAYVLATRNRLAEALWHFDRGGDGAIDQFNYGVTLARANRLKDAQAHLEASLRSDPNQPVAHDVLGGLLESFGRASEAAGHYREAIRLRPDFGKAHLDLGAVLLRSRQRNEAAAEFRLATKDPDPQIRLTALQGLRALGLQP